MQISEHSDKNIIDVGKKASKTKPDILYFADSLGSMNEKKILDVIKNLGLIGQVIWVFTLTTT